MDKYFEPINKLYLSQPFTERGDEGVLDRCLHIAEAYALAENAIVSMGDSVRNCSYCFFGGLADLLGLSLKSVVLLFHHFMRSLSSVEPIRKIL